MGIHSIFLPSLIKKLLVKAVLANYYLKLSLLLFLNSGLISASCFYRCVSIEIFIGNCSCIMTFRRRVMTQSTVPIFRSFRYKDLFLAKNMYGKSMASSQAIFLKQCLGFCGAVPPYPPEFFHTCLQITMILKGELCLEMGEAWHSNSIVFMNFA